MRSTLFALLASAAIVSATGCAQNNIDDLVARISCSTSKSISKCLRADIDLSRLEEIEQCLVAGGCSIADATAEAVWFAYDCRAGVARDDLKRRQNDDDETTTSEAAETTSKEETTTKKTTAKTTSAKTTAKSTTAPSSTEATTTADSTTSASTTSSSSSDSTASSTTSTSSSSSTSTASQASATTTGTLACSVTTTKATSACNVSKGKTLSCVATTTEIKSCAPGNICFTSTAGADVCMKRDDTLTTSGVVVAIVFGLGIAATIIAVIAVMIRGKQKQRRDQQARLLSAAKTRSGRDIEAAKAFSGRANASDADLPLITPGGTRSDQANYSQQDYFDGQGHGGQGDSLTPPEYRGAAPPPPQLHQGLSALGQNPRY